MGSNNNNHEKKESTKLTQGAQENQLKEIEEENENK